MATVLISLAVSSPIKPTVALAEEAFKVTSSSEVPRIVPKVMSPEAGAEPAVVTETALISPKVAVLVKVMLSAVVVKAAEAPVMLIPPEEPPA